MLFDFLPFFVRLVIFVIVVRIIVGAVSNHNRRVRAHTGCCSSTTVQSTPVVSPVQDSVINPTPTEIKKVEEVPMPSVGEARFCPSCGAQRSPNAHFCTMCGSELT